MLYVCVCVFRTLICLLVYYRFMSILFLLHNDDTNVDKSHHVDVQHVKALHTSLHCVCRS
eukprot:m.1910 g.1910  ORF g.1910 m.1910 type:complete len:60 (+) comp2263_c0_seq1:123-302(+)